MPVMVIMVVMLIVVIGEMDRGRCQTEETNQICAPQQKTLGGMPGGRRVNFDLSGGHTSHLPKNLLARDELSYDCPSWDKTCSILLFPLVKLVRPLGKTSIFILPKLSSHYSQGGNYY